MFLIYDITNMISNSTYNTRHNADFFIVFSLLALPANPNADHMVIS